jgi:hypothetical protein
MQQRRNSRVLNIITLVWTSTYLPGSSALKYRNPQQTVHPNQAHLEGENGLKLRFMFWDFAFPFAKGYFIAGKSISGGNKSALFVSPYL